MLADASILTVFKTFARRWSHKFEKTNSDPAARDVWLADLRALGVTDDNLPIGLSRSAGLEWPPSPAELAALCKPRPEDLGIPPLEAAWSEAIDMACGRKLAGQCSHPVVWHAYYEAGDIGHMNEDKGRKVFEYAYSQAVGMALAGEALAPIPKSLPPPEAVRQNYTPEQRRAAADAAMERLRAMGFNVGQKNNESEEQSP